MEKRDITGLIEIICTNDSIFCEESSDSGIN